jgi:hypothetical protein
VTEIGRAEYQVGQKTTRQSRGTEGESIAQVVTESLNAESKKARNRSMLDLQSGNYDLTKVQDSRTITTLIETAGKQVTGAAQDARAPDADVGPAGGAPHPAAPRTPGGRSFWSNSALR